MPEQPTEYWSADRRFGVRVDALPLREMLAGCARSGRHETGGILVGRYTQGSRLAVITAVSGPTPDTKAGRAWLIRGVAGLSTWLSRLWKADEGFYLGEWHFHPFAEPVPSGQDLQQMRRIAKSPHYQCAEPILVVLGGNPAGAWTIRIEIHTRSGERFVLSPGVVAVR